VPSVLGVGRVEGAMSAAKQTKDEKTQQCYRNIYRQLQPAACPPPSAITSKHERLLRLVRSNASTTERRHANVRRRRKTPERYSPLSGRDFHYYFHCCCSRRPLHCRHDRPYASNTPPPLPRRPRQLLRRPTARCTRNHADNKKFHLMATQPRMHDGRRVSSPPSP
jgi:hypothetical protein